MNKKIQLLCLALCATFLSFGQTTPSSHDCGTGAPDAKWDYWFNKQVETFVKNQKSAKPQLVNYVIPVIVHVIHFGEAIGTFPNIDSNQVKSQILVMNQDFSGNGAGLANVPSAFSNLVANTGIQFCRATKNPVGTTILEPGIDRISAATNGWQSPATPTLNLISYFNSVIIPATIWDPTKYLNIWVSDKPTSQTVKGFATYPGGTGLTGLFGGNIGSPTNDGIWVWGKAFGTTGAATAPYDKGRTAVHELGHWLGLRHIWGDGNCLSDYCNDTPTSKQAHYGCVTSTPPDLCGVNQSPNGEMPMNFMDMTDDLCKYMFTHDQNIRIQTAMSQCGNRNLLGSHSLCNLSTLAPPASSAIASFNLASNQCLSKAFTPFNTSSGYPNPTYVWSASPAASFSPAATVANPAITVNNPGFYTITLVATNSVSSSSYTMLISATSTCAPFSACLDTLRAIKNIDTLRTYNAPNNTQVLGCQSGFAGFLTGTNCYKDREFAQYFAPSTYTSTSFPQVNSVIVLFDSTGTKASPTGSATQIVCKIYGGTVGGGPGGVIGSKSDSLGKIAATTKTNQVTYIGNPGYVFSNKRVIPFKFDFPSPVIINANSGFFAGVTAPVTSPADSIKIISNTKYNNAVDSSAWFLQFSNNWRTYRYNRNMKIQLAIIPQITCSPIVGIKENQSIFASNVNVVPNPNNGVFNLVFTLPEEQTIDITITNSLGQQISREQLGHVANNVLDVDLSTQPNGIYFLSLSNGKERILRKIVINH